MYSSSHSLVCLYLSPVPTVDFQDILTLASTDARLSHLKIEVLTELTDRLISFSFGGHFAVQVLLRNKMFDPDPLSVALWGSKTTTNENNFEQIVLSHESYIQVTVETEKDNKNDLEARRNRLYALQLITEHLYKIRKPDLLYSSLARSFTEPAINPRTYHGKMDSRIFEQAVLSSRGGAIGSGAPIGGRALGGQELTGYPILFQYVPFPSWAVTNACTDFFVQFDRRGLPPDGARFKGVDGFEEYLITHHAPTDEYPKGYVLVTIKKNAKAQERDLDGALKYPDLLSTEKSVKRNKAPKRKAERSVWMNLLILGAALAISFAAAYLAKS